MSEPTNPITRRGKLICEAIDRINAGRVRRGLEPFRHYDIAEAAGISRFTLSRLIRVEDQPVSIRTLRRLGGALELTEWKVLV